MKILLYLGTSRQGNYSQHVAKFVQQVADQHPQVETELVTSLKYEIDFSNEGQAAGNPVLTAKVKAADAFILIVPEYNHGYPATIKYFLDLNYHEFKHKPVGLVGVSSGSFGGARAIESLLGILKALGMIMIKPDVNFSHVQDEIDKQGQISDPDKWQSRVEKMLGELILVTKKMQSWPSKSFLSISG